MSPSWPLVRLGELLEKSEESIEIEPDREYKEVTVKLWGKGVILRRVATGADITASSRNVVRTEQFILSRIDARNGAAGIVPGDLNGAVVSGDFPVFKVKSGRLLAAFLGWMSRTAAFVDRCRAASEGTTNRVRLKEDRFLAQAIPLPPIEEQRRLVAKLDGVADGAQAVSRLRGEVLEAAGSLTTSLHMQASGGRSAKLGDLVDLAEHRESVEVDGQYPQVGIRGFGAGLFAKPAVSGSETTYREFNKLFDGAVVLSQVKGWEGAIDVCPVELADHFASPEYRTFRCRPGALLPAYASYLFKTPWFLSLLTTLGRGVGARRERARPEAFLALEVPMPAYETQRDLLPAFSRVAGLVAKAGQAEAQTGALVPAVLDRAFRGEL